MKRGPVLNDPPSRAQRDATKLDTVRTADTLVAVSHKLPSHQVKYLRMLAITLDREQRDLLSEAVALLEEKYGGV